MRLMERARPGATLIAMGITAALTAAVSWRMLLGLGSEMPVTPFADSHVWGFDLIHRMITGAEPLRPLTNRAGYPVPRLAPVLGWVPALSTSALRTVCPHVVAFQLTWLAAPVLAAGFAQRWLWRCGAAGWSSILLAVAWATSPTLVANMAAGNVDKAQIWLYPAWLCAAATVVAGVGWRSWLALVPAALVATGAALTEPYMALFLPLFGAPAALLFVFTRTQRAWGFVRLLVLLAVTAGAMAPAKLWFEGSQDWGKARVFSPAPPPIVGKGTILVDQAPSAEPLRMLVPSSRPHDWTEPVHVVYLGLPLCLVAFWALRSSRSRGIGALITVAGVVVAIGPHLLWDEAWVYAGRTPVRLPMAVLEALGYPTKDGGQYYRAAPIAALGLVTLVAGALRTRGAAVMLLLCLLDSAWATRGAWPRPMRTIDGRSAAAWIAASPVQGAVLTLPLDGTQSDGGRKLLLAALHGRATPSLPLHIPAQVVRNSTPLLRALSPVLAQTSFRESFGRGVLRRAGYAFVLWTPYGDDAVEEVSRARIEEMLGPPQLVDGPILVWQTAEPSR